MRADPDDSAASRDDGGAPVIDEAAERAARIRLAAFYFFAFGGLGGMLPFLPIVLRDRGFDSYAISAVMLLLPLSNLFAPPLWGLLADAFNARVAAIRATGIGCAVGALLLIPDAGLPFAILGMATYCFFRAPIIPLADSATYAALGARSDHYARIRVWGSAGFVVVSGIVGYVEATKTPVLMFGITAAAYACATIAALGLVAPPPERRPGVLRKAVRAVRGTTLPALFLGSAFYYVGHGAYDVYFGLHARALGHSDAFVGLAWDVGVTCEIGLMLIAPRLLARRSGASLLVVGAAASIVRWGALSIAESAPAILAAQTLHALTFGLWYVSLVKFVQGKAPDALRSSVQGLAQASMAIGMMGGYLGGAELNERLGGAAVFQLATAAAFVAMIVYVYLVFADRRL